METTLIHPDYNFNKDKPDLKFWVYKVTIGGKVKSIDISTDIIPSDVPIKQVKDMLDLGLVAIASE